MAVEGFDLDALGVAADEAATDEPVSWDDYEPPKEQANVVRPQPGVPVNLRITEGKLATTQSGALKFEFDCEVVDGPARGYKIRFQRASIKKWAKSNTSQAGNLFKACRLPDKPTTNGEFAAAFQKCLGKVFPATPTYRGYHKATDREYKLEDFPQLPDGTTQPFITVGENGQTERVWANVEINWFLTPPPPSTRR